MRKINWLLLILLFCSGKAYAQHVYQIRADSVRIYNVCDTAELIIENRTRGISGYLYNKGNGRTEFRRIRLETVGNNQIAITGQDTLNLSSLSGIGGVDTIYRSGDNIVYVKKGVTYTINAPITSEGDFVKNQSVSAQTASAWVSGPVISDSNFYVNRGIGSGTAAHFGLRSTGGLMRFSLGLEGAEAGSDSGANFNIWRYNDAGEFTGSGLSIERSTGNVGIGTNTPSSKLHVNGRITANGVTLGAAGNANAYNLELLRNMGSADRTGQVTLTGNSTVGYGPALHALGSPSRLLLLPDNGTAPYFSDDGGANYHRIWHENNHPAGIANNQGGGAGLSGPTVYSNIVTNSAGHLTLVATRSLTAPDIDAVSRTPSALSWNSYITSGTAALMASTIDAPNGNTWYGFTTGPDANYAAQFAMRGSDAYFRTRLAGVTGAWTQLMTTNHANSVYAPISGSANYIQNQFSTAQVANLWISGKVRTNNAMEVLKNGSNTFTPGASSHVWLQNADADRGVAFQLNGDATPGLDTWIHNGTTWINRQEYSAGGQVLFHGALGTVLFDQGVNIDMNRAGANYLTASNASGYLVFRTGGANNRMQIAPTGEVNIFTLNNNPSGGTYVVSNSGTLSSRTSSQVLSDIGAAPASGSGNYIRNQLSAAQSANSWISGEARVNGLVRVEKNGSNTALVTSYLLSNAGQTGGVNLQLNGNGTPGLATWIYNGSAWTKRGDWNATTGALTITGEGGVGIDLFRNLASGGAATGGVRFQALNNASEAVTYAQAWGIISNNTNGAEAGSFAINLVNAGSLGQRLVLNNLGNLSFTGTLDIGNIPALGSAGTQFLTHTGGLIQYRTAAQVRSDIGAAPASGSGSYIQNISAGTQSANFRIGGYGEWLKNGSNSFLATISLMNTTDSRGVNFQLNGDNNPGLSTYIHDGSGWIERLRINADNGEATFKSDDGLGVAILRPDNVNGTATGSLSFRALNNTGVVTEYARIWGVIGDNTAGTSDGHMGFITTTNGVPSTKMMLTTSGNLLINTTSDDGGTKLQINGNMKTFGTSENYRMINDGAYISAFNSAQTARTGYLQFHSTNGVYLSTELNIPMHFRTSGTNRITILGNGNVGIGTSSPTTKLDVAGDIRASAGNFSGNVTLGQAGVATAYNLGITRSISSVNYTTRLNVGSAGQAVLTASNGTAASDKSIYLNFSGDPAYSPNGGTTQHTLWHAGNQPVATTGTANTLAKRDASGAVYATGFFQSSMAALKENINDFTEPALPLINGLAIKEFTYKADDQHTVHFGIIADNSDWHFATKDHDRFDTNSSLAIAIKAIQELNEKNEMLEDMVKSLEERLAKLEKLLE